MATDKRAELSTWYAGLRPLTVDVVGEFAGRELFVVHGESLIRHCLEQARVDFDGGFQLLHAVYAVELFLSNLHKRGCTFDIIFFSDLKDVCAPSSVTPDNAYKYQLTRSLLISHLSRDSPAASDSVRPAVLEFESPEDSDFEDYLSTHAVHFFLCHDGDDEDSDDTFLLRHLIYQLLSSSRNVATINSVEFKSSKIFAPLHNGTELVSSILDLEPSHSNPFEASAISTESYENLEEDLDIELPEDTSLTLRVTLSVAICQAIRESKEDDEHVDEQIQAFLLHTAMLITCSLPERQCLKALKANEISAQDNAFLREFAEVAYLVVEEEHDILSTDKNESLDWDLYDLIDGRIFFLFLQRLRKGESFPETMVDMARAMFAAVLDDEDASLDNVKITGEISQITSVQEQIPRPSVLAFSHPVLDDFLQNIKLEQVSESHNSTADVVFEDLTQWHNASKTINANKIPAKPTFWAMKRQQKLMADIGTYSASLTNAQGKILTPETIVAAPKKSQGPSQGKGKKETAKDTQETKSNGKPKGKKGPPQKGGKAAALEAVKAVQEKKAQSQRNSTVRYWSEMVALFEKDSNLISRYAKAEKFAGEKASRDDILALGSEVDLYLCNILGKIWLDTRTKAVKGTSQGQYLIAMVWNWLQHCSKNSSVAPSVVQTLEKLIILVGMPKIALTSGAQTQKLSFSFDFKSFMPVSKLVTEYRALQLEYGGPYMDRRFDSQPDDRVRFEPDAWQRKVLDSIDANNSLLVIAPTSAGKTFISFYAMKKVLEESDDSVLVYVAPTKALVNQIAAEINAHYSKSYHGKQGKSVWAVYTRDARINNSTGCQILVTVPHVLQSMLLSPTNADGPSAWSRRVKRIIFDEVHCIGQSEEGVIWEQLLLLAPCPIVALSATVGNPEEFHDWLARSQAKKGYKVDKVVHNTRYSELRKFIYEPSGGKFNGLQKVQRLPVPGLDEGNSQCENLRFLHPVVALTDRNRGALADVSFEARDCFTLWKQMKETLSKDDLRELGVQDPSDALPEIIAKSDVIKWELNLKAALRKAMDTRSLAFKKLRQRLDSRKEHSDKEKAEVLEHKEQLFPLVCDLHAQDALPALAFNYDRAQCEEAAQSVLGGLEKAESTWKETKSEWAQKLKDFDAWQKGLSKKPLEVKLPARSKDKKGDQNKVSKLEITKAETSVEYSQWESFDPDAPLDQFSFADHSKLQRSEFDELVMALRWENLPPWLTKALLRGIGVHHSGMNRRYRQVVEILFRKSYLRLVVATGTLALGINMPCKTVIFTGDSTELTAMNYRQASGRAGRRGFDLLGNVVFNGIPRNRVYEIMSSRLPDLRGQFPISTTLILRLFGLLHGTKNSAFAVESINSLLSQTRLYLGGPEAEGSVEHHLRFTIEYLRRQYLLSAKGEPINFASLVGHLYFTENSVFAFHSLLKGGYFHHLCADIEEAPEKVMMEMMLVLTHLFSRKTVQRSKAYEEELRKSPSMVFLPRLPEEAEKLLIEHNSETLSVFKSYVHSYISHSLGDKPDRTLPFTQTIVGQEKPATGNFLDSPTTSIRSPFAALSGFTDDFKSIRELCSSVRSDVFLEESAIPYIPIWPHDTKTELNAYIYDFYKHNSMDVLVRDNHIKPGEVWFLLKDFSLTLSAIVTSLEKFVKGEDETGEDAVDTQDIGENQAEAALMQRTIAMAKAEEASKQKKPKARLNDNWEDQYDDEEGDSKEAASDDGTQVTAESEAEAAPAWQQEGGGLMKVLKAFTALKDDFDTKFRKVWA